MGQPELEALKAKYRAHETRQALNRAIRAEIEGGKELLDEMTTLYIKVKSKTNPNKKIDQQRFDELTEARKEMSRQICEKYGITLDPSKW